MIYKCGYCGFVFIKYIVYISLFFFVYMFKIISSIFLECRNLLY